MQTRVVVGFVVVLIVAVAVAAFLYSRPEVTSSAPAFDPDGVIPRDEGAEIHGARASTTGARSSEESVSPAPKEKAPGEPTSDTDPVLRRIVGKVVHRAGGAVVGARIQFVEGGADAEDRSVLNATTSDAEGAFVLRLRQDIPGTIEASCERYLDLRVSWTPPEGASGETAPVDPAGALTAEEPDPVVLTLERETAIAGHVTLPPEHSGEFLITLQRYSGPNSYHDPQIREFNTEDGSFYVGGIRAATYRVWAYAQGTFRSAMIEVTVAEGEQADDLAFTLEPGCEVVGRVYARRTGKPIPEAVVFFPKEHIPGTVNFIDRKEVDPRVRNAEVTTETGNFHLYDIPPGEHLLRALHPDYMPFDVSVEAAPDRTVEVEAPLDRGTGIRGDVLDEEGEPHVGAQIIALTMSTDQALAQLSRDSVDDEGQYYIRNLSPGPYIVVRILNEEGGPSPPKITMATVTTAKDAIVDFVEIPNLATARGRVVDTEGNPMSGVQVICMVADATKEFTFKNDITDDEGRYEIRNLALAEQLFGLDVKPGGSFAVVKSLEMKESIDYECDLVFHNLSMSGQLFSAVTSRPIAGEVLFLGEDQESFFGRAQSSDNGEYVINGLPPGRYVPLALSDGHQPSLGEVVELDEKLEKRAVVDFKLERGGAVEVVVVDAEGTPVDGAFVRIYNTEGAFVNDGLPPRTAGGLYRYPYLVPGEHTVRVTRGEEEPVERTFTAVLATTVELKIELP